jgi:DNA-binding GntR family transcriptional regulator
MARVVVQTDRLRDQIYEIIRESLRAGEFEPGQRLLEVDLGVKYGVSRTPIREALFQLARDGLLRESERGYVAPIYTKKDFMERLEVKRLLAPAVAIHVAKNAKPAQIKRLEKLHQQEELAHAKGDIKAFNAANQQFHSEYHSMCDNALLAQHALVIEEQFDMNRSRIHMHAEDRQNTIRYEANLLSAISENDPEKAAKAMIEFLDFLENHFAEHDLAEQVVGS